MKSCPRRVTRVGRALVRSGSALAVLATAHQLVNMRALRTPSPCPPEITELVSVLVPARDEAHCIEPLVQSLLAQRKVPDLEVLILDDESSDGTASVVRAAAGGDPRVRVLEGAPSAPGLPGKPNACAQLASASRGTVLVFVDADVVLAPQAVAAAVALLREARLDLVSPYPRQLADTVATRLVQPLLAWSWLATLPLRRAERSTRPSLSAANGQFLVVDAAALRRAGGFAGIAGEVLDDLALVRAVKRSGGRGGVVDGSGIAVCRMYDGWPDLSAGYRKSLWSAFGRPFTSLAVAGLCAVVWLVPPLAALTGSRAGAVGYLAAVAGRALAATTTGSRVWPDAFAHPVSVSAVLVLLGRSWWGHSRGTLVWKGRPLAGAARAAGRV